MNWLHALHALIHVLTTHGVHHWHWRAYGYQNVNGRRPSESGVVIYFGRGGQSVIGYVTRGAHVGYFGNAFGFPTHK